MITTVLYMLERTLGRFADKKAIFCGDASLSFAELHAQALSGAQVLKDLGVRKGDRVGLCMNKTLDQVLAILSVLMANAVFVPILPKLKKSNIDHIVNDCGMTALITDANRIAEVSEHRQRVKLIIGHGERGEEFPSLPYMRRHVQVPQGFFSGIGADTAAIIYSSGSTGRPKGIVISHRNLYDGARIVSTYLKTTSDDRLAGVLSLNFDYGLNQLWQTLYKGASIYFHDLVFPKDLFELVAQKRITALPVMPVIISKMFDPRFFVPTAGLDFSALRYVCTSGGFVSQAMIDHLRATFPKADLFLMYGLTEAFRSSYLPPEQVQYRPTSIGKAIPDVELYVLDEQGRICPPGVPGELVHRGGCIAKGYWNDAEKTAERFRQTPLFPGETVVFSGDLVKTDEEGYIYFIGRRDAMIKTSGYRVSPSEIEEEAVRHKGVTLAVAFGLRNVEIGEDIALAYATADSKPLNERMLLEFLKKSLPSYMVPRYLVHLESFPATGNEGKVDRVTVTELAKQRIASAT
jgi:acyl-CoA ligase (AMP-forming) (exosortase A-associated)